MSTLNQETQTDFTNSDQDTTDNDLEDVCDGKDVLILQPVKRRLKVNKTSQMKLEEIGVDEIKFYKDIVGYMQEDEEVKMDDEESICRENYVIERKKSKSFFNWKRLSGLDDLNSEEFKMELQRRLEAKSKANVIGWQVVSAKSAPKSKTNTKNFVHNYDPILNEAIKNEIYSRNLPLGIPKSIKTLDYDSDRPQQPPLVSKKDTPLKIYAPPIKKTGLLASRDGGLRRSYQIIRDGLVPRRTQFEPDDLANVDPEYIRRSLGKQIVQKVENYLSPFL